MNIFYLDPDPKTCAQMHCSKHVVMEGKWPENIQEYVLTSPVVPATILYPYFEMDVENLKQKGYIVDEVQT